MMSPTLAERRLEPPSTLMHRTDLAPVLSATSNRDSVWIISMFPTCTERQQPPRTSQGRQVSQPVLQRTFEKSSAKLGEDMQIPLREGQERVEPRIGAQFFAQRLRHCGRQFDGLARVEEQQPGTAGEHVFHRAGISMAGGKPHHGGA